MRCPNVLVSNSYSLEPGEAFELDSLLAELTIASHGSTGGVLAAGSCAVYRPMKKAAMMRPPMVTV